MATTAAMRPAITAAMPLHIMGMDMAGHITDTDGLIIVDIARLTIVRTTVRVFTGGGAAGRNRSASALAQSDHRLPMGAADLVGVARGQAAVVGDILKGQKATGHSGFSIDEI